jgi:hypothetical protein
MREISAAIGTTPTHPERERGGMGNLRLSFAACGVADSGVALATPQAAQMSEIIHLADSFRFGKTGGRERGWRGWCETEKKSHLSQTAVDSFLDYLYYSTQTP